MHAVDGPLHLLLEGLLDLFALLCASREAGLLAEEFGSRAAVVTLDAGPQMQALRARLAGVPCRYGLVLHGELLYNSSANQQFVAED